MYAIRSYYEGLYRPVTGTYNARSFGGIAQLGERLHGMQEVSGSIPLTSTKEGPYRLEA